MIEVEVADLRRASDVLADWDAGGRGGAHRYAAARGAGAGARRRARGGRVPHSGRDGPRWVHDVEPSVEDLFVSFVDKERKARLREQLRALASDTPLLGERAG